MSDVCIKKIRKNAQSINGIKNRNMIQCIIISIRKKEEFGEEK